MFIAGPFLQLLALELFSSIHNFKLIIRQCGTIDCLESASDGFLDNIAYDLVWTYLVHVSDTMNGLELLFFSCAPFLVEIMEADFVFPDHVIFAAVLDIFGVAINSHDKLIKS